MVTLLFRQSPLTILGLPVHTLSSAAAWQQRSGESLDLYVRERKEGEGVGKRMSDGGEGRWWERGWGGKKGNGYGGEEWKGREGGERVREEGDSQFIIK